MTEPDATPAQPPIEDYALLTDRQTAALVSREGSVDWLCLPRLDSEAVFAALLGTPENGHWSLAPADGEVVERSYLEDTFVVRTRWRTPTGEAVVTELMPDADGAEAERADLIRSVECTSGTVTLRQRLVLRFRYGASRPWVRRVEQGGETALVAAAGPDALVLHGPPLHAQDGHHVGEHALAAGESATWSLTWFRSWEEPPSAPDAEAALRTTCDGWRAWAREILTDQHDEAVRRSLLVLRALTNPRTGGIVAAATTSLPEGLGGERNWDYRYVWLRDSALALEVSVRHGVVDRAWRDWLLRAIAGDHEDLRIMYGIGGEHLDGEHELDHLAGYRGSRPVRIGNGAADQYQADVVGEVMIALRELRRSGVAEDRYSWSLQKVLLAHAEARFDDKDHGIWEMRGDLHFFTHGRAMMWAAFDCGIEAVEQHGLDGPVERWRELRDRLGAEIAEHGYDEASGSFTQTYDGTEVDASLLMLPKTGYCAVDDPRMLGTVARIERELVDEHGFVARYRTSTGLDGLSGEEHPFLLCTFWLVGQYAASGRVEDAERLFHDLLAVQSELGLLAEEYDPVARRQLGNYPQAFSHLGLIEAADALRAAGSACEHGAGTQG